MQLDVDFPYLFLCLPLTGSVTEGEVFASVFVEAPDLSEEQIRGMQPGDGSSVGVQHFDSGHEELREPAQLLPKVKNLIKIEKCSKMLDSQLTVSPHHTSRIKEDLKAEWDHPPYRPRSEILGNDAEMVPGSKVLGRYVGDGLTWKQFRSTDVHARNLRTMAFESLAQGRGVPENCQLLIAVTESLSGKLVYHLASKLMDRLCLERVMFSAVLLVVGFSNDHLAL